jgi:hypothetical protein
MSRQHAERIAELEAEVARLAAERVASGQALAALDAYFSGQWAALNERVSRLQHANWRIYDDGKDGLSLQIELGNDYAVTLAIEEEEDGPVTALWGGAGTQSFDHMSRASFRAWLDRLTRDSHT